eukprot:10216765-Alexandrium_andersonii.AAC.1
MGKEVPSPVDTVPAIPASETTGTDAAPRQGAQAANRSTSSPTGAAWTRRTTRTGAQRAEGTPAARLCQKQNSGPGAGT